eukprot:TRINITY_DN10873_c0_g1_i1.p1 TRINITY_DN10873_c0_g1~~TRINITY_DN10873_c0_g1_i1.p1  ORF type:complete len:137 (-),score=10.40 TRINITY_DN10873_c0_g1_i1:9-419(-)
MISTNFHSIGLACSGLFAGVCLFITLGLSRALLGDDGLIVFKEFHYDAAKLQGTLAIMSVVSSLIEYYNNRKKKNLVSSLTTLSIMGYTYLIIVPLNQQILVATRHSLYVTNMLDSWVKLHLFKIMACLFAFGILI